MLEYSITWAYIEKDPEKRSRQYSNDGLRIQLQLTQAAKTHPQRIDPEHMKELVQNELQFQTEYDKTLNKYGEWERKLIERAKNAGLLHVYDIFYRTMSLHCHPDSNTSNYFFTNLPNGMIGVHEYNNDVTKTILWTALMETNLLMSILCDRLNLSSSEKYESIREKLNRLPR